MTNSLFGHFVRVAWAASVALTLFHRLLSHQVPEQHAEDRVRGQTKEDRAHPFIQAQQTLGLAHFQHTVQKPTVEAALKNTQQLSKTCSIVETAVASTHSVGLVHRLVVETCADDVKRRHGDGHGHSADGGGHQSGEPAVRTEPL